MFHNNQKSFMLSLVGRKLRQLCSRIKLLLTWKRPRPKVVIRRFGKLNRKCMTKLQAGTRKSSGKLGRVGSERPIRIASFNVAMFSLAPAVPKAEDSFTFCHKPEDYLMFKNVDYHHPKSILKQSPLHATGRSPEHLSGENKLLRPKLKVSINLPDNEISLAQTSGMVTKRIHGSDVLMRSPVYFPFNMNMSDGMCEETSSSRSILEVLRELDADILCLQDVKAEEERGMKPLSDLADALGMKYVFAESWAPEYGNTVLSRWPIKRWTVKRIADDDDFRNVIKATIDVPQAGELDVYCTQLDHLDERWRMKQINAIIRSNDSPHILAGGLNSLTGSDYSIERWMDIVKYYEDLGKPTPRIEVMKFLKEKNYIDAKDFAGECEPVVIIAKGQNVQGTCKYGTRVDYILASPDSSYEFVPGSYSVISSKGLETHQELSLAKQNKTWNAPFSAFK
ncbi:endonuclease/exonuclease/phosphatase family protein [Tripterygium wilfordii]|uniref:Endonuclease/exonuclease/phosphatase family protein n=1 Tax=Tripterygium wilfordii TaxID=458696 RepID=A0A7J7CS02_TRIWF|nr:endonuclease/exonuclease/phosphatase family protein [Tripterygium wilfordii]